MIAVRVQAHPSRVHLREALFERLSPLPTEVLEHSSEPPNPWEGYRRCLTDLPDCSHVLIIQDDALPCLNFVPALEQIAEKINHPVCLFVGAVPASTAAQSRRAMIRGQRYIPLQRTTFVPLVAVLWPRHSAQNFLLWANSQSRAITRADDGNAARWMIRTKQQVFVSVPSLVEHNDCIESVKGGRPATWGKDRGRVAALLAEDGLAYDW